MSKDHTEREWDEVPDHCDVILVTVTFPDNQKVAITREVEVVNGLVNEDLLQELVDELIA